MRKKSNLNQHANAKLADWLIMIIGGLPKAELWEVKSFSKSGLFSLVNETC